MARLATSHVDPGVRWLLASKDPSVRYYTLTDILGLPTGHVEVVAARRQILKGSRLRALLRGHRTDGGFGVDWYKKWGGAQWRLVSAVELGIPSENPVARRAAEYVLARIPGMVRGPPNVAGRYRVHASMLGNPLGVCSRLGMWDHPRVHQVARSLVAWQWPDGGWNCDRVHGAAHSSFYESLATLWGLNEYLQMTGDREVRASVERAAELFLRHRLFRSCRGSAVIDPRWTRLHYPVYWHYDILQALRVLDLAGKLRDARTREALDLLESKRSPGGTWGAEGRFWHLGDLHGANAEVVDWGGRGPNEMITLNAVRVLTHAGRIG
jgi:hypothetical protein